MADARRSEARRNVRNNQVVPTIVDLSYRSDGTQKVDPPDTFSRDASIVTLLSVIMIAVFSSFLATYARLDDFACENARIAYTDAPSCVYASNARLFRAVSNPSTCVDACDLQLWRGASDGGDLQSSSNVLNVTTSSASYDEGGARESA